MNNENERIMKAVITRILGWIGLLVIFASCERGTEIPEPSLQVTFDLTLQSSTRTPQNLNPSTHTAKVYMFREETSGSGRYVYSGEQSITGSSLTIGGLLPATNYRFVFLAVPRNQQPALPVLTSLRPAYTEALATYVSGTQTANEVFRHILGFTASASQNTFSVVLTRQNGALQIRLDNSDGKIKTVKLEVESAPQLYLQDGSGGQVLTSGTPVTLSKSEKPSKTSDYRISICVLPTSDLTGKGRLTITRTNNVQTVYSLRSTAGRIPVYANQITWIVLDDSSCSLEAQPEEDTGQE